MPVATERPARGLAERTVTVVVPARNEAAGIADLVAEVRTQNAPGWTAEVVVVDDGSSDATAARARAAGARVLRMEREGGQGNPAAARNLGARESSGDPIVFLDSDCVPAEGWLRAILDAHERGETIVGGALDLPPGLPASARCDYYCGWYLIHSGRPAGYVPHHPPPNLSVRREAFFSTSGFTEEPPFSYTNEERRWEAELRTAGHRIWFEPRARVLHHNRPGFLNLLKRNYRWAYTAIESKSRTRTARWAWLYRWPWLTLAATPALTLVHTAYITGCWVRAGRWEPVLMLPGVLASRAAYAAGMAVGGWRWLRGRGSRAPRLAPRWQ